MGCEILTAIYKQFSIQKIQTSAKTRLTGMIWKWSTLKVRTIASIKKQKSSKHSKDEQSKQGITERWEVAQSVWLSYSRPVQGKYS